MNSLLLKVGMFLCDEHFSIIDLLPGPALGTLQILNYLIFATATVIPTFYKWAK